MPHASIRRYAPGDLDALYRICLETGASGEDATSMYEDPQILGQIFAAPYGLFEPSLAFVAEDELGVGGYILGALDSKAFEKRLESDWWPALRRRYPAPPSELPPDQWTPDQRAARLIHVPHSAPDQLVRDYPSHLHIDLLPRLQSQGAGRRLMDTLIRALREQGSTGLHLFVSAANQRAVAFYRHIGFTLFPAEGALFPAEGALFPAEGALAFVMDLRPSGGAQ